MEIDSLVDDNNNNNDNDNFYNNDYHNDINAVITVFICTVVVITTATMFLSCFGKKKDKNKKNKKNKEGKRRSPSPPINAPPPSAASVPSENGTENNAKPVIRVENVSPQDTAIEVTKRSEQIDNFKASSDSLSDFSAVRETEILRSYRKPPPPQNRARQSRAPRALKSSAENLDIFSELNNGPFQEATDSPPVDTDDKKGEHEPARRQKEECVAGGTNDDDDDDDVCKRRASSQGRSSMLEDINKTLASIHSETSATSTEMVNSVQEKGKEVKEDLTSEIAAAISSKFGAGNEEEEKKSDEEENKDTDAVEPTTPGLKDQEDLHVTEELEQAVTAPRVFASIKNNTAVKSVEDVKEEIVTNVGEEKNEIEENVDGLKDDIAEKSIDVEREVKGELESRVEAVDEEVEKVDIEQIVCDVKEKVESEIKEKVESSGMTKLLSGLGLNSDDSSSPKEPADQETLTNHHEEKEEQEKVTVVEKHQVEEPHPKIEMKIPPKVSPKPSPKNKARNVFQVSLPSETLSASQHPKQPSSPQPTEENVNNSVESHQEKNSEKIGSPATTPTTPTSPTSPTSKGQSRIPMTKKASGIPKFAFSHNKTSNASSSPLASPDSTAAKKLVEQAEDTALHKAKTEVAAAVTAVTTDLKTNHTTTPTTPTSEHVESEMSRSTKESSPFNEDGRGSKSKLSKLRYSGRKKSSESKSEDSGSERGSRAGSEAKSDDGKKTVVEDPDAEKNSRIPVRGGSKPRSSPPKSLGN